MHKKKMIAPIAITVLFVAYYIFYFVTLITTMDGILRWLMGIIPVAMAATMLYVCRQRIQEIRSGEEDDLSQY